jgi:hypothetical protein
MATTFRIRDDFQPGFYAALGKVVVAWGCVEYELKLVVKDLLGKGFTIGMAKAESIGQFCKLCKCAKALADDKLPEPHRSKFIGHVELAKMLARERNDHVHAAWTSGPMGHAMRIRPWWDKKAELVDWERSSGVSISDLDALAAKARVLQRAINATRRRTWPKVMKAHQSNRS